jgi:predicted metal-dependent HD superfamily phosphohydrolase
MSSDRDWLRAEWDQLIARLEADATAAEPIFADLVQRYSEPHRAYHNLHHIRHVLETINQLADETINPDIPKAPDIVRLAGWFHDVIYDPRAKDNEERSAAHAEDALRRLGIAEDMIRRVGELILLTKKHTAEDADGHVLVDADLAILGAPEEEYRRYAAAIREEYAWVPEEDYRKGRRQVLGGFLSRLRHLQLFWTAGAVEAFNRQAITNLECEFSMLLPESEVHGPHKEG